VIAVLRLSPLRRFGAVIATSAQCCSVLGSRGT
jgi:hypothetical protein